MVSSRSADDRAGNGITAEASVAAASLEEIVYVDSFDDTPAPGSTRGAVGQPTESGMVFNNPSNDRYFEDYVEGDVHRFGSIAVEADEVITFAKRFDPQTFHVDPDAAKLTPFGGLIASGWHTAALTMRMFAEHYLTHVASFGSPGLDELRWLKPVRPGDTLSVRATVLKSTPSKSKPDRGAVTSLVEVLNQLDDVVMTFKCVNIIGRRPAR
jgi:acyl dehydratase